VVTEFLQTAHEGASDSLLVQLIEVVSTEIVVGLAVRKHEPDRLQQAISQRHECAFGSPSARQALVEGTRVTAFGRL
jgi:hypothetical protein